MPISSVSSSLQIRMMEQRAKTAESQAETLRKEARSAEQESQRYSEKSQSLNRESNNYSSQSNLIKNQLNQIDSFNQASSKIKEVVSVVNKSAKIETNTQSLGANIDLKI